MRKSKNKLIVPIIIVIVILVVIGIFKLFTKDKDTPENVSYAETLQDGTKINTSEKLKETKTIDGIELKDIELKEQSDGTAKISAIAKNTTEETISMNLVQVKLVSNDGQLIQNAYISITNLGPNAEMSVSGVVTNVDVSKVYNAEIQKLQATQN